MSQTGELGQTPHIFFLALAAVARPRLANISSGISQMIEINLLSFMAVFSDCRRNLSWRKGMILGSHIHF